MKVNQVPLTKIYILRLPLSEIHQATMSVSLLCHRFLTAHDQVLYFPCQQVCKLRIHSDSLYTGIGILFLLVFLWFTQANSLLLFKLLGFFTSDRFSPSCFFVPTVARVSFWGFFGFTLFFLFCKLFRFTFTTAGIGYTSTYASQSHFSRIQTGCFSVNSSNMMQSLPTVGSTIIFPSLILFWQHNRALSFQQ